MAKKKKGYSSLTEVLKKVITGKDFNHFQITSDDEDWVLSPSFDFKDEKGETRSSMIRDVQSAFDMNEIQPFIKDLLNFPDVPSNIVNRYCGTKEYVTKLKQSFLDCGFEVEEFNHTRKTWIWMRIPNTDYKKLEDQLKQIQSKL